MVLLLYFLRRVLSTTLMQKFRCPVYSGLNGVGLYNLHTNVVRCYRG